MPTAEQPSTEERDVSCRCMVILLKVVQEVGLDAADLVEGTDVPPDHLLDWSSWLSWADYVAIIENVTRRLDREQLVEVGKRGFETPMTNAIVVVNRALPSEAKAFAWLGRIAAGPDSLFYRPMTWVSRSLGEGHLEIELTVDKDPLMPEGLAVMMGAAFAMIPTILGGASGEIDFQRIDHGFRFHLTYTPRKSLFPWLDRWKSRVRPDPDALATRAAYELVLDRNAELRKQLEALRRSEEERERLSEELESARRLESVGRLAGGIAHDFNNVLTVIQCHAELLHDAVGTGPGREDLAQIVTAAEGASRLTRQLLAFSRQQVLQPATFDLADIVLDMEPMLRSLVGGKIELSIDHPGHLCLIHVDRGQMEQVVMNLAVNARDAMPEGGQLRLDLRCVDDGGVEAPQGVVRPAAGWAVLSVRDSGHGMNTKTRARVFDPFFTTKGHDGTGLGLATVHGIAHQSGGFVDLQSTPGRGSTFHVYLPRSEAASTPPQPNVDAEPVTVLIVDDQEPVLDVLCRLVASSGHEVLRALGPEQALEVSEGHPGPIDVLLTDVVMPGRTGPELAEILRSKRPELAVVFMSGYASGALCADQLDGAAFLAKPVAGAELRETLARVVAGRRGQAKQAR